MRRRALLRTTAATTALGAFAGCLDSLGGNETETEATTTEDATTVETTTESTTTSQPALEVTSKQLDTTNTACGTENAASIAFDDATTTVSGKVQTKTPCHEAEFVDFRVLGDVVEVTVGASETDAENCQSCIGHVEYEGSVETNRSPHSFVVVHEYTPEGEDEPVTEVVADKANSN